MNDDAVEVEQEEERDGNDSTLLIAGIVSVLVILIVVLTILFVFRSKAKPTQPIAKIDGMNASTKVVTKPGQRQPRVPRAPVRGTVTNIASRDNSLQKEHANAMYDTKQSL